MAPNSRIPAWALAVVVLGTLLTTFGISFDIQWHDDVGPDTFFTLSHLMLYAGSALAGFASLAMVLVSTSRQRAGQPVPLHMGGPAVRVFGARFTAPLGYLVAGTGAASFLLFGALDFGWHEIYGFDAVLNSPPHIALFLSITLTMVGGIIVGASARRMWWGKVGTVLSACVLMAFAPLTARTFDDVALPFDTRVAGTTFACVIVLIIVSAVIRRPGSILVAAAAFGMLQILLWPFSTWAAHGYADASGLSLRDGLTGQAPSFPSSMPLFLVVAAAGLELVFLLARQRRLGVTRAFTAGGAAAGTIISITLVYQDVLFDPTEVVPDVAYLVSAVAGGCVGALAGFLGTRTAVMITSNVEANFSRRASPPISGLRTGAAS